MTQHITLTAEQANTLNTTGRLEGFNELCEWQPPNDIHLHDGSITVHHVCGETWAVMRRNDFGRLDTKELTPTRAVGQVYPCKEPHNRVYFQDGTIESRFDYEPQYKNYDSRELPNGHERLHAKIATEPTLSIHEGKLVWTYDLVKE